MPDNALFTPNSTERPPLVIVAGLGFGCRLKFDPIARISPGTGGHTHAADARAIYRTLRSVLPYGTYEILVDLLRENRNSYGR